MTTKKKSEPIDSPVEIDFATIAIALAAKTNDAVRMALKAGDRDYIQSSAEFELGDLVVNISDLFFDESCLVKVGVVLEIRDTEIEIRQLNGCDRAIIPLAGTYLAAKGAERNA